MAARNLGWFWKAEVVEDSSRATGDGMSSKFRHWAVLLGLGTGGSSESSLDLPRVWWPQLRGHRGFQCRASASLLRLITVAKSRWAIFLASRSQPLLLFLPPWLLGPLSHSLCKSVTFQKSLNFSTGKV